MYDSSVCVCVFDPWEIVRAVGCFVHTVRIVVVEIAEQPAQQEATTVVEWKATHAVEWKAVDVVGNHDATVHHRSADGPAASSYD